MLLRTLRTILRVAENNIFLELENLRALKFRYNILNIHFDTRSFCEGYNTKID